MIDLRHPLAVLTNRIPWSQIEAALAPALAHKNRAGRRVESVDLFGASTHRVGAGVSTAGRSRLPVDPPDGITAVPEARLRPER